MSLRKHVLPILIALGMLMGIPWANLPGVVERNAAALQTLKGWKVNPWMLMAAEQQWKSLAASDCRVQWMLGLTSRALQETTQKESAVLAALECSPDYLPLVMATEPNSKSLSWRAVQIYPDHPDDYFWLAEQIQSLDPTRAQALYLHVTQIEPRNGLAWCRLGRLMRGKDDAAALHALTQCCYNGDPGSNGCYNAGYLMEQYGDYASALNYYHLSRLVEARDREYYIVNLLNIQN